MKTDLPTYGAVRHNGPPIYLRLASNNARLSALYNLIRAASLAVDNNDRVTAKAVLTNAEHVVLAMMEQGK